MRLIRRQKIAVTIVVTFGSVVDAITCEDFERREFKVLSFFNTSLAKRKYLGHSTCECLRYATKIVSFS